jgi:hypothetical protein
VALAEALLALAMAYTGRQGRRKALRGDYVQSRARESRHPKRENIGSSRHHLGNAQAAWNSCGWLVWQAASPSAHRCIGLGRRLRTPYCSTGRTSPPACGKVAKPRRQMGTTRWRKVETAKQSPQPCVGHREGGRATMMGVH